MSQSQEELFNYSKTIIPGGVHSPVRSFKGMTSAPRFFKSANGAKFIDIEEKEYIDFCMSFGPLILGHQNTKVKDALVEQLSKGWSYGACEPYSVDLAKFLVDKIPHIDKIRFVNSGTEAVMTALRIARGHTGKNKIIKFNGCYHGHVDSMLIKAGSGLAGTAEASSAGVPKGVADDTLILELNDLELVKKCFADHPEEIAAIIIEPLPANNGLLPQSKEFLQGLRQLTEEHESLLIFDEVISGFRVSFGGMSEILGIEPDLVTYGKIIGGGLPVGAIGGKHDIMNCLAPVGNVYQAGTLSANPLAMVAGLTTLSQMTVDNYRELNAKTDQIVSIFENWLKNFENGRFSNYGITSFGSLFWFHEGNQLKRACDIPADINEKFLPLFEVLLEKGIYLAPNAYEVGFISLAHDDNLIEELKERLYN